MSADNGVYVLKTGRQYRVAPVMAIERLYINDNERYCEEMQPKRIVEIFGDCKFTYNADKAFGIACAIKEEKYYEYGIVLLNAHKTWKQILEETK